jgi:FKBP-type peptidyl-prolyl cis-trans isomerase
MKKYFLVLIFIFNSCSKDKPIQENKLLKITEKTSRLQKMAYSLGNQYGKSAQILSFSEDDIKYLIMGLDDRLKGQEQMELNEMESSLGEMNKVILKNRDRDRVDNEELGRKWISDVLNSDNDYQENQFGLAYKVLKEGEVEETTYKTKIMMRYHSYDREGNIIDTMVGRNPLPLSFRGLFPAWKQAYSLSGSNSVIEIIAPASLTYGKDGALPKIKAGQFIKYKLEFFDIKN